jgi:hypothetical protein
MASLLDLKVFFKEKIIFSVKAGTNKANFAEHIINLIKRRLYMMMQSEVSTDWPKFLPLVADALNKKPIKFLGNVSPIQINSELDNVKIRDAQRENDVFVYKEPTWQQQNSLQENYPTSGNSFQSNMSILVK